MSAIQELIEGVKKTSNDFSKILMSFKNTDNVKKGIRNTRELYSFFSTLTSVEEDVIEYRLKKIIREEHPYLPAIDIDKIQQEYVLNSESLSKLFDKFLEQRQELIRLLHSTPAIYWDRTGFHELEGHVTFEEFVRRMIRKDKNNLIYLQEEFFSKKS
ncbi:MAG: hypothetical protein P8Y60_02685 [Calditrichota bacterium]